MQFRRSRNLMVRISRTCARCSRARAFLHYLASTHRIWIILVSIARFFGSRNSLVHILWTYAQRSRAHKHICYFYIVLYWISAILMANVENLGSRNLILHILHGNFIKQTSMHARTRAATRAKREKTGKTRYFYIFQQIIPCLVSIIWYLRSRNPMARISCTCARCSRGRALFFNLFDL